MTRRTPVLEGSARKKLNRLLAALRAGADINIVKSRTMGLLNYKPSEQGREEWLRAVLPEEWHAEEAIASLSGGSRANNQQTDEFTEPTAAAQQPDRSRKSRRETSRRRR